MRLRVKPWAVATCVATFLLILLGGYVKATGAGLACPDWPTCYGTWYPFHDELPDRAASVDLVWTEWLHRAFASLVGLMLIGTAWAAWKRRPKDQRVIVSSAAAVVLVPVQYVIGGLTVLQGLEPLIVVAHLGLATVIFACTLATVFFAYGPRHLAAEALAAEARAASGAPAAESRTLLQTLGDWLSVVKPGILSLLLVAGITAMLVAGGKDVTGAQIGWVTFAGTLMAGAANAFNNVLDRDIDAAMVRTRKRPIPSGRIRPVTAALVGSTLGVAAFLLFWRYLNPLTAWLALGGWAFYVLVYTLWLKRTTAQNIVIGGLAGCFPALVGWAAVSNELDLPAILLGSLVFLWTPPHFWALALAYKEDYAKAAVPMMPNAKGERRTRVEMMVYTVLLVGATVALAWPLDALGTFYLVAATLLGGLFLWHSVRILVDGRKAVAMRMFHYSILYLGLLFAAMVLDKTLFAGWT